MTRVESVLTSPTPEQPRQRWQMTRRHFGFGVGIVVITLIIYGLGRIGFITLPLLAQAEPRRYVSGATTTQPIEQLVSPEPAGVADRSINLSETALTTWLRQQPNLPLTSAQVTVEPATIEVFGRVRWRPTMAVTAVFEPNQLTRPTGIHLTKLRLGTVTMPLWLGRPLLGPISTTLLNQLFSIPEMTTDIAFGKLIVTPLIAP